jgi:hypothetical protein
LSRLFITVTIVLHIFDTFFYMKAGLHVTPPKTAVELDHLQHRHSRSFIVMLVLAMLIIVGVAFWQFQHNPRFSTLRTSLTTQKSDAVLFTVGDELIYQTDLEQEKSMYLSTVTPEIETALQVKLQEDSILLQEAGKQGLLVLDKSFYNSPSKNYQMRMVQVAAAKQELLEKELQASQGELVAIWFYNTAPAPMGYEAGKKVAFEKITALHKRVIAGELTMKQAGEQIKADASLAQVDPAYQSNAYDTFVLVPDQKIVFEDRADQVIRATPPGAITDVLVLEDSVGESDEKQEALYLFAQIANTTGIDPVALTVWLEKMKPAYAITAS